ncbi:MAG: hypothetical protein A4E56_03402 [Pelotomaculum sp. PtaU1.Bin065]|nr:MAG: hypothetical protein A4E56_03402 [Pelotomaculum sp. PtaU1.Bin065]
MKTFFRDFSIDRLTSDHDDLEELIDNRQGNFYKTVKYTELDNKIKALLNKLTELSPETEGVIKDLEDNILHLECICYSSAYKDGMADLMAAITLNNLHITKVELWEV